MDKSMSRIERQLWLYELVCGYAITSFEAIAEVFPGMNRRLMRELYNEDIPLYEKKDNEAEGEIQEYVTSKDCYNKLFPGLSERTRQRDFEVLCRLGHQVFYDHRDRCFRQEEFSMGWAEAPEVIDDDYLEGKFFVS